MITAVVLAAGESRRMGRPKMLLPWGDSTVIEHVLGVLESSGPDEILVVLGGEAERVRELLEGRQRIRTAINPDYARGEMLESLQFALAALPAETRAALVCLGDQPQVQAETVRSVCESFRTRGSNLVVPSYRQRRGHPWLVARPLWAELLGMQSPQTPRGFLNAHAEEIHYVAIDTPSVLEDLDTPEDYRRHAPGAG